MRHGYRVGTCTACENDIELAIDRTILRVDAEFTPRAELLYCCTACTAPGVLVTGGDLLTVMPLAGMRPVALREPTFDPSVRAPDGPAFTRDDLLARHELLSEVCFVTPWE